MLLIRRIPVRGRNAAGEVADGLVEEAGSVAVDARRLGWPFYIGDPECVIYLGRAGCFNSSFRLAPVTMLPRLTFINGAFISSV